MSSFRPGDTPESDYGEQSNFELSDFFTFDEWTVHDEPSSFTVSDPTHNPIYRAQVVGEIGGSSSGHEGPSTGKHISSH